MERAQLTMRQGKNSNWLENTEIFGITCENNFRHKQQIWIQMQKALIQILMNIDFYQYSTGPLHAIYTNHQVVRQYGCLNRRGYSFSLPSHW